MRGEFSAPAPWTDIAPASDKAALYDLAYEESGRALAEQQTVIDSFRTRAGLLMSVAAITTSFLGAQALGEGSSAWAWLAMAGFVGVAVASLAILWPRRWELTTDPRRVIKTYIEADEPALIDDVRHDLSLYMHRSFVENKEGLERLTILFQIASVLLTVEVVLWIAAIAPTG
jgi:hypothetical protein